MMLFLDNKKFVYYTGNIHRKIMETLEQTLKNTHDWSRERIHVLCEGGEKEIKRGFDGMMKGRKMQDDAFALFSEFEEWYDENLDDQEIFSIEYIGEGSEYN